MDYLENLQILRDVYYRLSERSIFFEYKYNNITFEEENRPIIEEYIKNYCKEYGLLDKYNYLVGHVMLLRAALHKGREIQQEEFYGTLGLNTDDRLIKDILEHWNTQKNNQWYKDWVANCWDRHWSKSTNKEKFIQEYGQEYIDEIIKEIDR